MLLILTNMNDAKYPKNIPSGIPINASIVASNNTFFLTCFLVAPMLLNIPYCLFFSVIEISKLFLIQNTDVNIIIPIAIATTYFNPKNDVPLLSVSNDIKYLLDVNWYFAFFLSFANFSCSSPDFVASLPVV